MLTLAVLAVSSVLNALYYIPALIGIWSHKRPAVHEAQRDIACSVAIIGLCLGIIALGIGFTPVMDVLVRGIELL